MEEEIYKYFSNELDHSDESELFSQLETSEELRENFIRLQNIFALVHLSKLSKNESTGRRSFQSFMQQVKIKKQRRNIHIIIQYAAIALLLITSTALITKYFFEVGNNMEMNTLFVPAGHRAHLTLQDGTLVWLNAKSTLTYPARFTGKTRRVTVSGEAYFDVAKNPKKPFIVSTQNMEMKVLGTQFNVSSYPEAGYTQTNLIEGSLMIYNKKTPRENIILKPNEQVIVKNGKMFIGENKNPDYFIWKDGIYTFDNERLIDIIKKLQLYFDVKIVVKDPEIFNMIYTGKFRQCDGIDEILRIIQKVQKFKIQKDTENNIITITK